MGGASMHVRMGSHFFVKEGGDTPCSSPISVEVPFPTQLRVEWVGFLTTDWWNQLSASPHGLQ